MKKIFKILFTLIIFAFIVTFIGVVYIDFAYDMDTIKTIKDCK